MAKHHRSEPDKSQSEVAGTEQPTERPVDEAQNERITQLERRLAELTERLAEATPTLSESSVDVLLLEQQNERIAELQRLIANLGERMTTVQAVNARDEQFKAAVRSVETAAAAVQRSVAPATAAPEQSPVGERQCSRGPCECVSCDCCTFEVWMTHVRVDHMQNPIIDVIPPSADSNVLPTGMMEVWMFASIDPLHNIGRCFPDPSPTSYLPLHKQLTDPYGPWVAVNGCVGSIAVKKGIPITVPLSLTVVEREDAAERVQPLNRDEWGSATQDLTLDCCYSSYPPILIPVGLTSWGQAGGAVTGRFIVVKRC